MSQAQIAKLLSEHYPKYLSYMDILTLSNLSKSATMQGLKRLRKREEIEYIVVDTKNKKLRTTWQRLYRYNKCQVE